MLLPQAMFLLVTKVEKVIRILGIKKIFKSKLNYKFVLSIFITYQLYFYRMRALYTIWLSLIYFILFSLIDFINLYNDKVCVAK